VVFLTLGVLGDERAAGATTARSYTSLATYGGIYSVSRPSDPTSILQYV